MGSDQERRRGELLQAVLAGGNSLHRAVADLRTSGVPADVLLADMEFLRLQVADTEEQDDEVLEVMDRLTGWCSRPRGWTD